jgi:hypothetical protein
LHKITAVYADTHNRQQKGPESAPDLGLYISFPHSEKKGKKSLFLYKVTTFLKSIE